MPPMEPSSSGRRVSARSEPLAVSPRPYQKPNRLSVACTQCRRRKVRCDSSLPRCRNCRLRGDKCETLDLRELDKGEPPKEGSVGVESTHSRGASAEGESNPLCPANQSQDEVHPRARKRQRTDLTLGSGHAAATTGEDVSWVSQAYQASAVESHCVQVDGGGNNASSTPDVVLNTDESSLRTKFLGGSSVQSLCNFVDLHLTAVGLEPLCESFNDGMRHSEEFQIPLAVSAPALPALPPWEKMKAYTQAFTEHIWPFFPVVDPAAFEAGTAHLQSLQDTHGPGFVTRLTPLQITHLAMAYAVACIGHDELQGCITQTGTGFLTAAYGLYPHLVAFPYVSSVQALMLLSLALKGQVKEGQAWQTLGQAIRVAHSIGLHKRRAAAKDHTAALHSRIWWACCALERVMQLESGRPTQLGHGGAEDALVGPLLAAGIISDLFASWLSLTVIMGRIAQEVYANRPATLLDLLQKVQELDAALLAWERTRHRGGSSAVSSILLMQYNFAHMTLLRLSVMFPPKVYLEQLSKHRSSLSSYVRLGDGAHFCSTAARATITEALHLGETSSGGGVSSTAGWAMWMGTSPLFLATIVLALGIMQQPLRRVAKADLELLALGTDLFGDNLSRWMGGAEFASIGRILHSRVSSYSELSRDRAMLLAEPASAPQQQRADEWEQHVAVDGQYCFPVREPFEGFDFGDVWDMIRSDLLLEGRDLSLIDVSADSASCLQQDSFLGR